VQLLAGTLQEAETKTGVTRVRGFLGPERNVALRWQSRAAEVARKALLTCETTTTVQATPTVVKYKTDLRFEILQGAVPRLVLTLPATQALTKLQGEGVRDWQIKPEGDKQTLTVEFIKPVEKSLLLAALARRISASPAQGRKRPALVVDDDLPTREFITEMLTSQGRAVVAAAQEGRRAHAIS
jgi:hypothetical protein